MKLECYLPLYLKCVAAVPCEVQLYDSSDFQGSVPTVLRQCSIVRGMIF